MKRTHSTAELNAKAQHAADLHRSGHLVEAAAAYRKLLVLVPASAQIINELGTIALQAGKLEEGVQLLGRSLEIAPNQPITLSNRAFGLLKLNRPREALEACDKALAIKQDYAEAHYNRGAALTALKHPQEAVASYERAVALKPDYAEAYHDRGNALLTGLNRPEEALASYDSAISIKPNYAEAYHNRAAALTRLNRFEEAVNSCDRALALKPDLAEAHYHRGSVLTELNCLHEALASYDRALAIKPDLAEASFNKSILKLLHGEYEEGWQLYEWRWKTRQFSIVRNFTQGLWLGNESIVGKTLLIYPEQGLGDYIQFCRYAQLAQELDANIVLEVPPPLISLISTLPGHFKLVEQGQPLPQFDLRCPLMSLPFAFKTTLASIPGKVPYLYANDERQSNWRSRLGAKKRARVGLVWSGSSRHHNDRNRSIPLALLQPILSLPLEFHSLQQEIRAGDASLLEKFNNVQLHHEHLIDFSDTAALILEMDVVITVDTAVAHLAGALGTKVWILLPCVPDYRWLLRITHSRWYPSAVLFRQEAIGDWRGPVGEIAARLHDFMH